MPSDPLVNQIFSGGTALAGFLLVFLGVLFASYESFDATQKTSVKSKYRTRATIVFLGFLASLLAASAAVLANWICPKSMIIIGVFCLATSFVFLVWAAISLLGDIS